MKYFLIVVFIAAMLGCSTDKIDHSTPSDLKGKWIESKTKSDTLTFESLDHMEIMTLGRGKEMKEGNLLPKSGSGPYEYTILEAIISLRWILSSNSNFISYDFEITGNKLNIGNFYGSNSGSILTFEKLD